MPLEFRFREGGAEALTREPGDLPAQRLGTNGPRVEGEKDTHMNTASRTLSASASSQSRIMQLALAGVLGIFIVGFSGFAHIDAVHNAAHDYRHSMGFPCH